MRALTIRVLCWVGIPTIVHTFPYFHTLLPPPPLQVEPFLLAPAGAGSDERRRRKALLQTRNDWLSYGYAPEELPGHLCVGREGVCVCGGGGADVRGAARALVRRAGRGWEDSGRGREVPGGYALSCCPPCSPPLTISLV